MQAIITNTPAQALNFRFLAVNRKTMEAEAMFRTKWSATRYAKGKPYIKLLDTDTPQGREAVADPCWGI